MNPITFSCDETLPLSPEDISRQILDLTKWPDFHGFGPLPGIKVAVFEVQTPGVVGTRFHVTNLDGSSYVEEIVEWQPNHRLRLQMKEFSPPLSRLATGSRRRGSSNAPATKPTLPVPSGSTPSPLWHGCCCGGFPSSSRGPSPGTCGRCDEPC